MTSSPTVSVRGEATLEVAPELAALTVTVEAHGGDRRSALELLSRRSRAVAELVTRFEVGIERSEMSRLHVYPELDSKRTEKVRRYVGRSTNHLLVHDFGVLSDLLIAATSIELVSIDGPWWQLRPTSDVFRRARLAAVEDAVARARDYAAALGAEIVALIEIADQGMSSHHAPRLSGDFPLSASLAMGAREGGGPDFSLEPARQQVIGHVEASFLLTEPDLSRFPTTPT